MTPRSVTDRHSLSVNRLNSVTRVTSDTSDTNTCTPHQASQAQERDCGLFVSEEAKHHYQLLGEDTEGQFLHFSCTTNANDDRVPSTAASAAAVKTVLLHLT
jgi:hypothetical protein